MLAAEAESSRLLGRHGLNHSVQNIQAGHMSFVLSQYKADVDRTKEQSWSSIFSIKFSSKEISNKRAPIHYFLLYP